MSAAGTISGLSDRDFRRIVDIAASEAGLAIPEAKRSLVQSRIGRRMRALGLDDCGVYLDRIEHDRAERGELISVLTTNVSHFFREKHHFHFLRDHILSRADSGRMRFWSAGCSNGQEPYSLAIQILRAIPDAARRDILILASDIDPKVLARAEAGIYAENEVEGVDPEDRRKFFTRDAAGYAVRPELRQLIRFRQLNLNADWPMRGTFDVILCRNVVIYFDDATQLALWPRFRERLPAQGILMLGHSERIHPLEGSGFKNIGVTTYRKLE